MVIHKGFQLLVDSLVNVDYGCCETENFYVQRPQ